MNDIPQQPDSGPSLSDAEQRALDRLVERGWHAATDDSTDAADERRVLDVIRLLEQYPAQDSDPSLIDATLARIQANDREQANRLKLEQRPRRFARWADLGGIAAVVLLAAGVAWPVMARMRSAALQAGCASNMRAMGAGLTSYATDHRDYLPMTAGLNSLTSPKPSMLDWNTYEHGGNLVMLIHHGYCSTDQMQCPGCAAKSPHRHISFRMPASDRAFRLTVIGRGALIGDANPALELHRMGKPFGTGDSSASHDQRGQNVLFGDGALLWLTRPEVEGDNLYLQRGARADERLPTLVELSKGDDAFLAQ